MPVGTQVAFYYADVRSAASKISAFVKLYDSAGKQIGSMKFWRPDFLSGATSSGTNNVDYPEHQFSEVIDLLRNESPVFFHPTSGGGLLSVGQEPVGEEET